MQCLLETFRVTLRSTDDLIPFISSRVKEVVFLNSTAALCSIADDEETKEAIGPFVDEYATALDIYVSQACSETGRQERIGLAWNHAMTQLTGDRMTATEAARFWKSQFTQVLPHFSPPDPIDDEEDKLWPSLPEVDDVQQTEEWNPMADEPPRIKSRELSPAPACIDCMLTSPSSSIPKITTAFRASTQKTIALWKAEGIWNTYRFRNPRRLPRSIREGLVVSALLYLDSWKGGSKRLLASPSPDGEAAGHYPLLFLDEEFLLRKDLSIWEALDILERYLDSIQPRLLLDLANACVDELSAAKPNALTTVSLEGMVFKLVSLLTKCDKPALAAKPVQNIILNYPNASSWHRSILQRRFLKRLSPHDTREFLVSLVTSVQSILEQQKLDRERLITQE